MLEDNWKGPVSMGQSHNMWTIKFEKFHKFPEDLKTWPEVTLYPPSFLWRNQKTERPHFQSKAWTSGNRWRKVSVMGKEFSTRKTRDDKFHERNYVHRHIEMYGREIKGKSAGNLTTKKVTQYKPGDRRMPVQSETVKQSRSVTGRAMLCKGTVKQPAVLHIDLDQSTRLHRERLHRIWPRNRRLRS